MKICLVSDYLIGLHNNWSGAELVCQFLASLLKQEGNEVSYLTTNPGKKVPKEVFSVPVLNSPVWFLKKIIPFHIPVRALVAFFQLRKTRPEAIHLLNSSSLFIPVMIAARILKIPTTFTVLDYFIICPARHLRLKKGSLCHEKEGWNCLKCTSFMRILERKIVRRLAEDLKQIITFTETSKKRLVEHGFPPDKIKIKYIYKFSLPPAGVSRGKYDILFIGTLKPQKGLDIVLRALPAVLKNNPGAKLTVVGRGVGPDKERIEGLIKDLGIGEAVEFLGQKDNQEALKIISESKLVVVAEQWFSDFGPVVLLESLTQGRPVVASNIGSAPEFIQDGINGFLVESNEPAQFAEKIDRLLANSEEREEMGRAAQRGTQSLIKSGQDQEIINLYTNK